ncbi:unnamed protein product [Lathyrus sativus]|nr:unnamed protein product [Lathyrus sativus]
MSVLISESSTKDFKVNKGLRQGDPLSPFLFILVMEGLNALTKKAEDLALFKVFGEVSHNIIQFADDTTFIGEGNWDNLWFAKAMLRGFELISGLKVNFFKSSLYGVNCKKGFLDSAAEFLNSEVSSLPLKFFGTFVGDSPRRIRMWSHVIELFRSKLTVWKSKKLEHWRKSKKL